MAAVLAQNDLGRFDVLSIAHRVFCDFFGSRRTVTVPPGVRPGQAIHVMAPDGSGRLIEARVPQGLTAGSTFMVQPPSPSPPLPLVAATLVRPSNDAHNVQAMPVNDYSTIPPLQARRPFSMALDDSGGPFSSSPQPANSAPISYSGNYYGESLSQSPPQSAPAGQKLLLVNVPPGMSAGSTLHVQVPNEPGRLLQAQVPSGNVSSFHVAYTPNTGGPSQNSSYSHGGGFGSSSSSPAAPAAISNGPSGQKLIFVRVPPGSAPGSMLHVQVPNEPGRLLQAQVPPGNVSQFHVAYTPNIGGGVYQQPARPNHYQNHSSNNASGVGFGSAVVPIVGGLAAGLGAAMVYEHFAHNDASTYATSTGYDDDFGGSTADYGGSF
jgi:hypothetical protein